MHEVPKDFTYESEHVMAFPDIYPLRPVHLLVIPKTHVRDFLTFEDSKVWEEMERVLKKLIKDNGLDKKGYRLGVNGGGAQLIDHFHVHLLGPIKRTEKM
jgi:histidine triad (HIT) family protein